MSILQGIPWVISGGLAHVLSFDRRDGFPLALCGFQGPFEDWIDQAEKLNRCPECRAIAGFLRKAADMLDPKGSHWRRRKPGKI